MSGSDRLAGARSALSRGDWQGAGDAALGVATSTDEEAERLEILADSHWWLGRLDECIDARERAYTRYDESGDHCRAGQGSHAFGALRLREAEQAHGGGDLRFSEEASREVVLLGRHLRDADLEAEALQTLGRILIDEGRWAEGLSALDDAMLFAIEGRLRPYSTGKVYCSMISACETLGDIRRAGEWCQASSR